MVINFNTNNMYENRERVENLPIDLDKPEYDINEFISILQGINKQYEGKVIHVLVDRALSFLEVKILTGEELKEELIEYKNTLITSIQNTEKRIIDIENEIKEIEL